MLTQITASVLYFLIAASVLFQIVTAARCAVRAARKRNTKPSSRPVALAPVMPLRARRPRQREYRLALRMAKASLLAKS